MVIVGGPDGDGDGAGAAGAVAAGVGDVGAGDDESLEHAAKDVSERKISKRSGIILDAGAQPDRSSLSQAAVNPAGAL